MGLSGCRGLQPGFRAARGAAKFHESHDLWLAATLGTPPMKIGTFDIDERDIGKGFVPLFDYVPFTALQNVTGQPAISLPLFWNAEGLPIGVQLVGAPGADETLLALAEAFQAVFDWAALHPPVC